MTDHRHADPVPPPAAHAQVPVGPRCATCGDPIQPMDHPDGGWIHSPGSDTRCLDARPKLCDRCGHPADEHSVYGCYDECGCPDRPDLAGKRPTPAPAPVDEALAQRVAAAARVILDGTGPRTVDEWATLVARAVLGELAPELARVPLVCSDERHQAKVAALEAALARVRKLHRKASDGDTCVYCAHGQRLGYDTTWPCDTIRALNAPAQDTNQPSTIRVEEATAALREFLAAVRTYRDADTGQPIHAPGRITPEQLTRWQRIAHGGEV